MKVYSPLKGKLVALDEVPDPVFAQKMMGDSIAIQPSSNRIVAPVTGTLTSVFPTKHAFGIETEEGVELLIHIGIDTVNLKGEYFDIKVDQGDHVTVGDTLVNVDFETIKKLGCPIITPVIIINNGNFSQLEYEIDKNVNYLDEIIGVK